jgi:V/A-type H+-transporting ATPase subunit I
MMRPRAARWFEILAAREDATLVLGALGETAAIELEARPVARLPEEFAQVESLVVQFVELQSRYHAYWPASRERCSAFPERPVVALTRSLATIRAWAADAEPVIAKLQALEGERRDLVQWSTVLAAIGGDAIDLSTFAGPGPVLRKQLFVFPPDAAPAMRQGVLAQQADTPDARYVLAIGTVEDLGAIAQQCTAAKGKVLEAPGWFAGKAADVVARIATKFEEIDRARAGLASDLDAIGERHDLLTALGDAHRLQWVIRHVRALESGELFCWITGWTSDFSGHAIVAAVDGCSARALVHFPPPPSGLRPPLLLANPWWARPFEVFSRALGMPSGNEADPSALLALAVPLMFGYMFGDVGQGAVLAIGGALLARRIPLARLFVAGGLSAVVFGFLFGSVFSLHGFIAPLWIDPLASALDVLVYPLYGGAVVLALGLALAALESWWRREMHRWLGTDAGLGLVYLSLIVSVQDTRALWVAALGAGWFCAGHGAFAGSVRAGFVAAGELVERVLQLLINTLSFARVGAFALAHAGLSAAIVALVLVLGNAIVIVLETLVVSIQTTRLVLFEFFTRFLVAEGRVFRPLPTPSALAQEIR